VVSQGDGESYHKKGGIVFHRPVCVKCEVDMRPETNGVHLIDMASFGPYRVWHADLWKCPNPECGVEIIVGFCGSYIAEHYMEGFPKVMEHAKKEGNIYYSREIKYD